MNYNNILNKSFHSKRDRSKSKVYSVFGVIVEKNGRVKLECAYIVKGRIGIFKINLEKVKDIWVEVNSGKLLSEFLME